MVDMTMKRSLALFLSPLLALSLAAQAPKPQAPQGPQEVVLQASSGAKLVLGLPSATVQGGDPASVDRDFSQVLRSDLEHSGVFSLAKGTLPATGDAATWPGWRDAGCDWIAPMRLTVDQENFLDLQVVDAKAGKAVFSKRFQGRVPLRQVAHAAADQLVAWLTGVSGTASTHFIFVKQVAPGVKELYRMDRDGAGIVELTRYGSLTLSPTVAPDGRIAFVTYKGGSPQIWGQRAVGGAFERLYPAAGESVGLCNSPCFSPDGKRLAFVQGDRRGNCDIMMLDVQTGRVRRLTDGFGINTEPTWNPSGTQLAFTSDREGGPQVYLMQDDGTNIRRLTSEGAYNATPAWSPKGDMVAYVSRFEGRFDLFVYKLGEGKAYQITTGVGTSESPSWSPDGRNLVFSSNRSGAMQLYSTSLDGRQVDRVSPLAPVQSPRWVQ
jgi:TolB protein